MDLKDWRVLAVLAVLVFGVFIVGKASNMFASFRSGARIKNVVPVVSKVWLFDQDGVKVNKTNPYSIYSIVTEVIDVNGQSDIQKVNLTLVYNNYSGEPSEADKYVFIWDRDTGAYEVGQSGHLLSVNVEASSRIKLKLNFTFVLGLARMGNWSIIVTPSDEEGGIPKTKSMEVLFYAEISLYVANITFYGYPNTTVSANRVVNGTITANSNYRMLIKATDLVSPNNYTIEVKYLKYNVVNDSTTAINLTKTYQEVISYQGDYANKLYFELYFFLEIPAGTPDDYYEGTIYLAIENYP